MKRRALAFARRHRAAVIGATAGAVTGTAVAAAAGGVLAATVIGATTAVVTAEEIKRHVARSS